MAIDDDTTDPSDAVDGDDQYKEPTGGWDTTDDYWFAKPFHTETPRDLADIEGAEAEVVKSGSLVPAGFKTPCREGDPDRFHPETDGLTSLQLRRFKRHELAKLAEECATCPFRIGCAITALETDADSGVWAGVLTRDFTSADTWHRRQLLEVVAEFIIGYRAADPETIRSVEEMIYSRIETMLQRQPRLRPVLDDELADVDLKLGKQAEFTARFVAAPKDFDGRDWKKHNGIELMLQRRPRLQPVFAKKLASARKRLGIADTTAAAPTAATSPAAADSDHGVDGIAAAQGRAVCPPDAAPVPAPKSAPVGKARRRARPPMFEQLELEFAVSA